MNFKPLYHKGKNGEIRIWEVWTEGNVIHTKYGVLDGEMLYSEKKAHGKNAGRKNATTDEQQAEAEAQSMWTFKKDRKYSETIEDASEPLLLPMLAKEYEAKKARFPAYIQPKLDGVRCLAFWQGGVVKLISRAGKEWTVASHIQEQLQSILPQDSMFDGELYVHGASCQTITSWVKKLRPETLKIEYHIYDMPIVDGRDDLTFEERSGELLGIFDTYMGEEFNNLDSIEGGLTLGEIGNIILVETHIIEDEISVRQMEAKYINQGYEGAILRNSDGIYSFGYRSSDLLKIKTFKDAEFEVLDVIDGDGKFEGCACFICQNDLSDAIFECTMACSMEEKKKQFQNKDKYIGKKLTVKFFDRTDDLIPRFPTGRCFRATEDLPLGT